MSEPVSITFPIELSSDMLRAVMHDPMTSSDEKEEAYARIGWLICAWDVLVRYQSSIGQSQENQK